jgi:hypothetical protein
MLDESFIGEGLAFGEEDICVGCTERVSVSLGIKVGVCEREGIIIGVKVCDDPLLEFWIEFVTGEAVPQAVVSNSNIMNLNLITSSV